jgi:hypothetical protein
VRFGHKAHTFAENAVIGYLLWTDFTSLVSNVPFFFLLLCSKLIVKDEVDTVCPLSSLSCVCVPETYIGWPRQKDSPYLSWTFRMVDSDARYNG